MPPTLSSHAEPAAAVIFQPVGDEAVLLDTDGEQYFQLDPVGTRCWTLLLQDPRLQHAFDVLGTEYDVEPAQLEADLLDLVGQLAEAGLVRLAGRSKAGNRE